MKYFFIDTNVFLQCRDFSDIRWSEISESDDLEIIIPRAVQEEIDKLKADGNSRRAKRARNANTYLRKIILADDERLLIREKQPRVEITFSPNLPRLNDSPTLLDPARADDSIVLELFTYKRNFPNRHVELLTNDTNPMLTAKRLDIPFTVIPEGWLLEPELDDRDKKLRAFEARLVTLEKSFPVISLLATDGTSNFALITAHIIEYPPLSKEEVTQLLTDVKEANPMQLIIDAAPESNGTSLSKLVYGNSKYQPPSQSEIKKYQDRDYPNWLSEVEKTLEDFQSHLAKINNQ